MEGSVLTGGLTWKDRRGTIIDWNLCFNVKGESSSRNFKSGTPAFMAPVLLKDTQIPRRTLGHDMESFFAVIIWVATLDYRNEARFLAKPLARNLCDINKTAEDILHAKDSWFNTISNFKENIINHFELSYYQDKAFLRCIFMLRKILYLNPADDIEALLTEDYEKGETGDAKEDLFRKCMLEIDNYLQETKGCDEMQWIDSQALARHTPESPVQEGSRVN